MAELSDTCVLLSWVDLRTDPYVSGRDGAPDAAGPTLTLLFDPDSPYRDRVSHAVLFYRKPTQGPRRHEDFAAAEATRKEIERLGRGPRLSVELVPWHGEDPTDHHGLFSFLDPRVAELGARFPGQPLIIHISPGTPAMQTVWVLMAEMGLIRAPFTAVKSLPRAYRAGRPAVVPVSLDIPTFYKAFHQARPGRVASTEETVLLDPRQFVSAQRKQLYLNARRFAQLNVPILIVGERGTGKTTLASWIRSNSPFRQPQKDHSWPSVPCSQYSPETMRAELFGYVKGAFTDAKQDTEGLLHVADGDTLFLDEIGDISRDLQRLLIRALEEKRFTRVGARVSEHSAFRLITATNLPWPLLKERLDPDFLDRISVLVLEVPPLREVREDLPWLWQQVFQEAALRAGGPAQVTRLDAACHARIAAHLAQHPLPGNLRDLFRVAYHLLAVRAGAEGEAEDDAEDDDAVRYALERGLALPGTNHVADPEQAVAAAFARGEPLDEQVSRAAPLDTRAIERSLRRYLAGELRRIARTRGLQPQDLCDVTDRTLQKWIKED